MASVPVWLNSSPRASLILTRTSPEILNNFRVSSSASSSGSTVLFYPVTFLKTVFATLFSTGSLSLSYSRNIPLSLRLSIFSRSFTRDGTFFAALELFPEGAAAISFYSRASASLSANLMSFAPFPFVIFPSPFPFQYLSSGELVLLEVFGP